MKRRLAGLLLAASGLLVQGCGPETDVQVVFEPFACSALVTPAAALTMRLGQRSVVAGRDVLRPYSAPECISQPIPFTSAAVAGVFTSRGYVVKGVPADRESYLVLLMHLTGCTGPTPACLMSDPIVPGGKAQRLAIRGVCGPAPGTGDPGTVAWQLCSSINEL